MQGLCITASLAPALSSRCHSFWALSLLCTQFLRAHTNVSWHHPQHANVQSQPPSAKLASAPPKHDGVRRHWNSSQHDTQHSKEGESPCILLFFPVAPMKRMKSSFSLHFPSRSPFLPLGFPRLSPSSSKFSCCLSKLTKTEVGPHPESFVVCQH